MNTNTICRWLSITPFELGIHLLGALFALILYSIKTDMQQWNINYWQVCLNVYFAVQIQHFQVFSPCIAAAGLHMYYLVIIFVRRIRAESKLKDCFNDLILPSVEVLLFLALVVALCIKLQKDDGNSSNYGVIFVPIWMLLTILFIKSCEM